MSNHHLSFLHITVEILVGNQPEMCELWFYWIKCGLHHYLVSFIFASIYQLV